MGTMVAVRSESTFVLAADAVNLVEGMIHPGLNVANSCIIKFWDSFIGFHSSYGYQQCVEMALAALMSRSPPALDSKPEIKKFFQGLHDYLKTQFQLNPTQQPSGFETGPMNALVVNRHGIFKVDATRTVYEFKNYWAVGSAETFALGALHATYDTGGSAEFLARKALAACGEFESNRGREVHLVSLAAPVLAHKSSGSAIGGHLKGQTLQVVKRKLDPPISIEKGRKPRRPSNTDLPK